MKRRGILSRALLVLIATCALVVGGLVPANAPSASAADASQFNPGNIISDYNFFNGGALSADQVQGFLNSKVPQCRSGYTCLKDYRQSTWTRSADPMCGAYQGSGNESAAQIITKVGQACNVSQKVLLVLLEKEMSLVTDSWPDAWQYQKATGYACPDTAPCDAEFAGFYNQVYKAAWQYKRYSNPAGTNRTYTWFPVGQVSNIRYHPNAACGSSPVRIQNQATAGLYYYTPYQPNATAMSNIYGGQDDGCSAYGNRNFWRLFTDWFGSPTNPTDPIGAVDAIRAAPGGLQVTGWALDFDSESPIDVHVYVDNRGYSTPANLSRPDVQKAFSRSSDKQGFTTTVPASPGTHRVCVYGYNVGPGSNGILGCTDVEVTNGKPFGAFEGVSVVGGEVTAGGWAIDPDSTAASDVHLYVDGVGYRVPADQNRPDVGAYYSAYGAAHGFNKSFQLARGSHRICAYAIDIANPSINTSLGCRTAEVVVDGVDRGRAPIGNFEGVSAGPGELSLSGWAIDPDTAASVPVNFTVDDTPYTVTADGWRADVSNAFPGYGGAHGFAKTVPAGPGQRNVCAAIPDTAGGRSTSLGCRTIQVPALTPVGSLDAVTAGTGSVSVSGWAATPMQASSIDVHVYVGSSGTRFAADQARPDVQAAVPGTGPATGFAATVSAPAGPARVCVYAVDGPNGVNALLGCRDVSVG